MEVKLTVDGKEYKMLSIKENSCDVKPIVIIGQQVFHGWGIHVEKDYKILAFKDNYKTIINWHVSHNLSYDQWVRGCLSYNYEIHSVRRLSDGEVFTVGDKCYYEVMGKAKTFFNITSFLIEHNTMYLCQDKTPMCILESAFKYTEKKILGTTHDGVICYEGDTFSLWAVEPGMAVCYTGITVTSCTWQTHLKYFADEDKAKEFIEANKPKALFTSEDGVPVFEGDLLWTVRKHDLGLDLAPIKAHSGLIKPTNYWRFFSSIPKAEEYIFTNKPVLVSYKEIYDLTHKNPYTESQENIRDFFKSKINQP